MVAFNRVGCVNDFADRCGQFKQPGNSIPILCPDIDGRLVGCPFGLKRFKERHRFVKADCCVNRLDVLGEFSPAFTRNIPRGIAHQMDDAALRGCLRIDGFDGIFKPRQSIEGNE